MSQKVTHPFPTPQGVSLSAVSPNTLAAWFRELEDLSSAQARGVAYRHGIALESVLATGRCKVVVAGTAQRHGLPKNICNLLRGTIVCSALDADGKIIAVHGSDLAWHTSPAIHFSNPKRFRDGVYLAANTFEADAWAIEHNAAALGLNGCGSDAIATALSIFGPSVQVLTESWRLAA